jgi:tetratricopeptide (TPR) repeat protein
MAAAALVETLARAIDHAHRRGVVHRDLKPANVLLTADGQPRITDFGLAKIDQNVTQTEVGTVMGTLAYMAPEQAVGGPAKVGPAADIHALGALLYEALTGRPPYHATGPEQLYHQIIHSDVVPPSRSQSGVPRDLEAICLKCLEKSPGQRYATAHELAEDLRRFQRGESIVARRAGALRRSLRWARRHPWQTAEAATAVVAGLLVIAMTHAHNIELKAEIRRTKAQADLARLNYQQARATIQSMLAELADRRLFGSPHLLELRHKKQVSALAFYDRILREVDSRDSVVRADTARALIEASILQSESDRSAHAQDSTRRALTLIEGLRREQPADLGYLRLHIECLMKLCVYLQPLKDGREGVVLGQRAVQLAEQLAAAQPEDLVVQDLLASCHNNCGDALTQLQSHEAKRHFQKAVEIRARIDPAPLPGVTLSLAESLINTGFALWAAREYPRAEETFQRAQRLFVHLSQGREKQNPRVALSTAQLYVTWGGMLLSLSRADESIARSNAGLDVLAPFIRAEPNDLGARGIKLKLQGNRAIAMAAAGRHREAAGDWTKVIELAPEPVPAGYRISLAFELICIGEIDRAAIEARKVKPAPEVPSTDDYNLGCIFSRLAAAAQSATRASPAERKRVADSRIAEALGWLKSANELGFFRDSTNREHARHDPDLAILAHRDEFRRLISEAVAMLRSNARRVSLKEK